MDVSHGNHPPVPRRGGPNKRPIDLHIASDRNLPPVVCSRRRRTSWHHYVLTDGPGGLIYVYGGLCRRIDHRRKIDRTEGAA